MHRLDYPARFKHDKKEGGYIITFRDIPEAITQAETMEDCFIEATDCLDEAIVGRIDDNLTVSKPSKPRRSEKIIALPAQTTIKVTL